MKIPIGKVLGGGIGSSIGSLVNALSELDIDEFREEAGRFIGREGDCSEDFVPENYDEDSDYDPEYEVVDSPKSGGILHRSGVSSTLRDNGVRSLSEYADMAQIMGVPKSMTDKAKKGLLNSALRGMEDRNNDWLAKQIREEERILRRGDLMDLGASHAKSCDAGKLKSQHHIKHLSGKI